MARLNRSAICARPEKMNHPDLRIRAVVGLDARLVIVTRAAIEPYKDFRIQLSPSCSQTANSGGNTCPTSLPQC